MISVAAFVAVAALVGAVAMMFRGQSDTKMEERLDVLAGLKSASSMKDSLGKNSVLSQPLDGAPNMLEAIINRFGRMRLLFEQADTTLTVSKFFIVSGALASLGAFVPVLAGFSLMIGPPIGAMLGVLPLMWLLFRRKRRLAKFSAQLSPALELVARALRAGHSLASGFHLVQEEMTDPIASEFGRVFEEQNLGISMEEALTSLADRVPNLDLRFFSTAVILQRQTGGDLAEILDKIGELIRERFKIWGQVQALTGEGRISGVVLLGLPPVLFIVVYRLNPDYIMMLFTDPMGKQMLAGAIVLQLLGALCIRKIVNIKV
jgi:tight adherence protein B